jgi:hypothetical protein
MVALWVVFAGSFAVMLVAQLIWIRLVLMARRGEAGSEILAIGFAPVFITGYVCDFLGGAAGIWLAALLDPGLIRWTVAIVAGLMLLIGLVALAQLARAVLNGGRA